MKESRQAVQFNAIHNNGVSYWFNVGGKFEESLREKYPSERFRTIVIVSKIKPFWVPIRTHFLYKEYWKSLFLYKSLSFSQSPTYKFIWWYNRCQYIIEDPKGFLGH